MASSLDDGPVQYPGENLADNNYHSFDALLHVYETHAYNNHYAIVREKGVDKRRKAARIVLMCDKGGKYRDRRDRNLHSSRRRDNSGSAKTNCPFRIVTKQCPDGSWDGFIPEERDHHNHDGSDSPIAHTRYRNGWLRETAAAQDRMTRLFDDAAAIPLIIKEVKKEHDILQTKRDVYNNKYKRRASS